MIASSGDSGRPLLNRYGSTTNVTTAQQQAAAVNYPASSPYVTGVGGTEISAGRRDYMLGQGIGRPATTSAPS